MREAVLRQGYLASQIALSIQCQPCTAKDLIDLVKSVTMEGTLEPSLFLTPPPTPIVMANYQSLPLGYPEGAARQEYDAMHAENLDVKESLLHD